MKMLIYNIFRKLQLMVNYLLLLRKNVKFNKMPEIDGIISIHGHGNIFIGDNVTIHCDCKVNPIGGFKSTYLQTIEDGKIVIGDNVGISHAAITASKEVRIGNDVLVGAGCSIYDTDFHAIRYEERVANGSVKCKPVYIEDGVFIGAHSIILKGVRIGKFSVIGAGSVVTCDVPSNEIWAGNPAKFIGRIS